MVWTKEYGKRYRREMKLHNPWIDSFCGAKKRCNNPNNRDYQYYGGRGIKFLLTKLEIESLWFRDNAELMDCPTVDRIDNDGHYEYSNCRFIERSDNTIKSNIKEVRQYTLDNELIRTFKSTKEAVKITGISRGSLSSCLCGKSKTSHGFKWDNNTRSDKK